MRNAGLEEAQAGIKIAGRNINNLRYADDTTLVEESEEELKSLLMKVKGGGRSQDGGGIGRVITFSSTNSLKEQQNGEQSLQNNFWPLAADIRRP